MVTIGPIAEAESLIFRARRFEVILRTADGAEIIAGTTRTALEASANQNTERRATRTAQTARPVATKEVSRNAETSPATETSAAPGEPSVLKMRSA